MFSIDKFFVMIAKGDLAAIEKSLAILEKTAAELIEVLLGIIQFLNS